MAQCKAASRRLAQCGRLACRGDVYCERHGGHPVAAAHAAYFNAWAAANRDKLTAAQDRFRSAHPARSRAIKRASRERHIDTARASSRVAARLHYWADLAGSRARDAQYKLKHRDRYSVYQTIRRARLRGSEGRFTAQEWESLKASFGNRCLACLRHESQVKLTADHVVPVARGGATVIGNIQPLCRSCNSRKGARAVDYRARP